MRLIVAAVSLLALGCPAPTPHTTSTVVITHPPDVPPPPPSSTGLEPPQPTLRLPKNFTPTSYDARLAIDPAKSTFDGAISIVGDVAERSSVIWLHGRHLDIKRASAMRGTGPFEAAAASSATLTVTPRGDDLLEVRADPPLDPGAWTLAFEYVGTFDELNTTGAFKETVAGATYIYSQLEAVYARRVFPCVDEPDSKVPWKLALDAPHGSLAVSNTTLDKTTSLGDSGTRFEFKRTKPLPAYLVAFGVGPFEIVDAGTTKTGVPVRIVTLKGRGAEAAWAAKTTPRVLELLEDWFGMPYPYDKLDLLTIPVTVGFSAMENAGLVTLSERRMLVDPQHPSWQQRWGFAITIAHELAHQWFGDYVTTAWWDDIWLNEGFANWMERKIMIRLEPAWHDELGELEVRNYALEADSVISARKVRQPIVSPDDILNAFDGITYDKGASVLDMFETYVGPEVFQRGVREYLTAKAYGNATSADFVAAISKASGKDLDAAFSTFLDQAGEPELEARVACDGGAPRVELAQQRYVPPGSPTPGETKPWILPICVAYDRNGTRAEACTLLDQPTGTLALDAKTCPRWLLPNVGGRGYYRSELSAKQATALRDEAWPQLTWIERRALLFDVVEATRSKSRGMRRATDKPMASKLPLQLALSFVPKMLTGGDRFTVGDALGLPLGLDRLVGDDQRVKYEAWLRATFAPGATQLGLVPKDTDDFDAEKNRVELVRAAAWHGRDPELVKQAVELATRGWRDLPQAVRGTILDIATDASPELFDKILHDVKTERERSRREEMLGALASTRDPKRLQAAFELLLDPAFDFRESMWMLFGTSSEPTRRVAETFFRDHKDALVKRMPQDETAGGATSMTWVFTAACDGARRDELADYVVKNFATLPGGERITKQAIESMDQCIANRKLLEPEIKAWLGGYRLPKPKEPAKNK